MPVNPYIYDIEVFAMDWLVIARKAEDDSEPIIIHNNNHAVKELFNKQDEKIFYGFNNKHYDDWIIQGMLSGLSNESVKRHNDWIIQKHQDPWSYPPIQYQKREFCSSDLRDDLPIGLSLKAIEANMGFPIVETGVDFNIDRPLTDEELKLEIEYCRSDVDRTYDLYKKRSGYLNTKLSIGDLKGIDEREALGLTNAKLTAVFLDAERKPHDDEFKYTPPANLDLGKYQAPWEFFKDPLQKVKSDLLIKRAAAKSDYRKKQIQKKLDKLDDPKGVYQTSFDYDLAGTPHKYGWGGLHGAIKNYFIKQDDDHKILTVDVSSYYPSLMIQYGFVSRNIPSPAGFEEVYNTRIEAKNNGDPKNKPLKLVLNTTYGASKNQYNDLYDPRQANAVCITGQLFLTDLIDKLEAVESLELIQSNTDGIVIRFKTAEEGKLETILQAWESRVHMTLERTVIKVIAQKDVNNYVMKKGESYIIEDGLVRVIDPDEDAIKTKGGYVSLFGGGNFMNNTATILHKALVEYFMNDVPVETTINGETELSKFQIMAKSGSTYSHTWQKINDLKEEVQNVNRVFASTNENLGTLYKQKGEYGFLEKIANLPDHCEICNGDMEPTSLDRQFYIDVAQKRINDYLKEGKRKMATTKTTATKKKATPKKSETDVTEMNLYEKINELRSRWLAADVKKSGVNSYAEYKYFELADIIPVVQPMFKDLHLAATISFSETQAQLRLTDTDSLTTNEAGVAIANYETYTSPMVQLTVKGMNSIQALGAVQTYQRRYLYMMLLDIVEADQIDNGASADDTETPKPKAKTTAAKKRPAKPAERKKAKADLTDKDGEINETQIKAIKKGLKKLRDKDDDEYGDYITDTIVAVRDEKNPLTKKQAEDLLIEIGEKVAE